MHQVEEASKTIEFVYPVPPKITNVTGATVAATGSATLHCAAEGHPRPDLQWVFQENIVRPNSKAAIDSDPVRFVFFVYLISMISPSLLCCYS